MTAFVSNFRFNFWQEKLDEKKDVIAKLTYQLEAALADARRQAENQREKNIAKVELNKEIWHLTKHQN